MQETQSSTAYTVRVRWKQLALTAILLSIALVALVPFALHATGTWLVSEDPLAPAQSVVVFGGEFPFRAMEAADIYKQGLASQVWLTQGGIRPEDTALKELGIEVVPEYAYNRQVVERLGVPPQAIHVLAGNNVNTVDEVRTVARELAASGGTQVILVTSKYHARRVKVLWHTLIGDHPAAIVRYTPKDPFEPAGWWRNTGDAMAVSRELFGLVNAWAGFPVKSERW